MKTIKYFIQFCLIVFLLIFFKILGLKISRILSSFIFKSVGKYFRSQKICHSNLSLAFPNLDKKEKNEIIKNMWSNYGKIFAEYVFMKQFRTPSKFAKKIIIENPDKLEKIKIQNKPVIFISGHFDNFELMAMHLEKSGINLAAVYRPLNNFFLNPFMEKIRKKYICKCQIKKGISGTKQLLKLFKKGNSLALMIDQRVTQGIKINFFNRKAFTTTIPAQFVTRFNAKIVPIYIERLKNDKFKIKIFDIIEFSKNENIEKITIKLNEILEEMIKNNPNQWIWTHNRWKA